jgi:hypothetical protein
MSYPIVYNSDFYNTSLRGVDDETMGDFGASAGLALIGAAPGIFQSIMSLFGGGRKAQFQGLAEINAAGQQATQAMDGIKAALSSGQMAPAQAVAEAQKIVHQFNDPKIVYPAKKGDDAAARNNFIASLNQSLQQIQTLAANAPANNANALGGISTNTLLLVGVGLLAVMMLSKNNG